MTPTELTDLIDGSRIIHSTLGHGKSAVNEEAVTIAFAFSSVVSTRDIQVGELLSMENIWVKRPSGGDFTPSDLESVIGKRVSEFIPSNTQVRKSQLEK
jgi:N-acetylneuraminate synthase